MAMSGHEGMRERLCAVLWCEGRRNGNELQSPSPASAQCAAVLFSAPISFMPRVEAVVRATARSCRQRILLSLFCQRTGAALGR